MITVDELLKYVGSNDSEYAQQCVNEATTLVYQFVESSTGSGWDGNTPPSNIVDRAILETGSELFHRKNAPSGIQQFATTDGVPVRLNRDPMTQSYPLLMKWVVGF